MKFIVLASLFAAQLAAASPVSDVKVVRMMDGRGASFTAAVHAGNAGWDIPAVTITAVKESVRIIASGVFYHCAKNAEGKMAWTAGRAQEPIERVVRDGTKYSLWTTDNEVLMITRSHQLIGQYPTQNKSTAAIDQTVDLSKIVPAEELTQLQNGEKVQAIVQLFPRWKSYYQKEGGPVQKGGMVAGGSFSILFTVQKVDGEFVVTQK